MKKASWNIKQITMAIMVHMLLINASCGPKVVDYASFNHPESLEGKYLKDKENVFQAFLGTWEHREGKHVFRVILWKEKTKLYIGDKNTYFYGDKNAYFYMDKIRGHFEIAQTGLGEEEIIYTSRKKICGSSMDWPPVISGGTKDGISLYGSIFDNTLPCDPENPLGPRGRLKMVIQPDTDPVKAHWTIDIPVLDIDQPFRFNIPMDFILTKKTTNK